MELFISIMLITSIIAVVLGVLLKKYDIPPIIGYIFSGTIISYIIGAADSDSHLLESIAEFGIVFLMFNIGLEIKLERLIQMKKEVFSFGSLQVCISWLLFGLFSHYLFDFSIQTSIVIGAALSLSSTAIVLKLLNDSNEISKSYGQNTLGVLIFQDLAVIPILLILTILADSSGSVTQMLSDIVISAIVLLALMIIFGKFLLDPILKLVTKAKTHELFIMVVLIIAIGSSSLAHYLGFTYSLGAFIGGMLIAETHYKHQVEADLIPFRDLFLALFFVTVGMHINLGFFIDNIFSILSFSIIIMLVKALVIFSIILFFVNKRTAFQTSLAISQVGEFSFVIFTQAKQSALIDESTAQLLTLSVIVSMIITPFILKNIPNITNRFMSHKTKDIDSKVKGEHLENHIIVCGYGGFGQQIISKLKVKKAEHIAIVNNYEFFEKALENGEHVVFGNPTQKNILLEAGILKAKVVVIAVHDVETISLISHMVSEIREDIPIIAKVTKKDIFDPEINTENFIDIYASTAKIIAKKAVKI